ncbi:UDP-glucuronosyltransferase 2B17-like isoform X2 [Zootermopsis nevadensis]|nr:UDP-glucuronosyltransferase 2B17-like isoform X2 [Zootermopsis nevadensis]XP_021932916.1 UDP-glucuronosyltransferase 2B17-like isoform X2 [Zootermopsis nevadensis]
MDHRTVLLLLLGAVCCTRSARILGIFPSPSISHQLPFQNIMKALASRGHQITVISPSPLKTPLPNYTDVDLSFSYEIIASFVDVTAMVEASPYEFCEQLIYALNIITEHQLSSPPLQAFIRSNDTKYDLVFLEALMYQSYHGLIHHVGSPPVIGILSVEFLLTMGDAMGTPTNPAIIPDVLLPHGDHMTFHERLQNTLFWLWTRYKKYTEWLPAQEELMRKFFGPNSPSIIDAERNISLLMVSSNWIFNYPIPLVPSVVTFHSLHVKTKTDPLPEDLQKFLDEAEDGVIYFSLGSNVQSDRIPEEKRIIFLEVFSELPQKILWKWESDILPRQPSNVKIGKWLPQQDVLAHPNIKMFISQCGLQSFQEAVYFGVPILGIPFFGDQKYNAKKIVTEELGVQLSLQDLTKETLSAAINAVLNDPRYQNSMKKMSAISKDEPQNSLDRAVWWTEYVIRHKGAKHLRSAAHDLAWYQYLLLDIVAVLILLLAITIFVSYIFLKNIYRYLTKKYYEVKSKHD